MTFQCQALGPVWPRAVVHLMGRGRIGELTGSPWDAAATPKHVCLFLWVSLLIQLRPSVKQGLVVAEGRLYTDLAFQTSS